MVLYEVAQAWPGPLPLTLRNTLLAVITQEQRHPHWLWGYNDHVMIDADDTSFALQLLVRLKRPIRIADLAQFYQPQLKAYTTFILPRSIAMAAKLSGFASAENNDSIHLEVNANLFHLFKLLQLENKINYQLLIDSQSPQGYWEGYFYPSKFYATYRSLKILCDNNHYKKTVDKALRFLYHSQHADGSWGTPGNPYDTAFAIQSLLFCMSGDKVAIAKGAVYLLSTQMHDGAWASNQPIWTYTENDSPLHLWVAYDHHRVLTTALALHALHAYGLTTQAYRTTQQSLQTKPPHAPSWAAIR